MNPRAERYAAALGPDAHELSQLVEQCIAHTHRRRQVVAASTLDVADDLRAAAALHRLASDSGRAAWRSEPAPAECVTTDQAAELLGITARQVRRRITTGRLPAIRAGRAHLVPLTALVEEP